MNGVLMKAAESILYISALLADQPRPIDRFIDYFGESPKLSARETRGNAHAARIVCKHLERAAEDRRSIA